MKNISQTNFSTNLALLNGIDQNFVEWHFTEGMGFQDKTKWWVEGEERKNPHEGLDLLYFHDQDGITRRLDLDSMVPPLMVCEVVSIFSDFIGKSILFSHPVREKRFQLCSILGHVLPAAGISPGKNLDRFDQGVARISPGNKKNKVPPHLHISIFWCESDFPLEKIDWFSIQSSPKIILVNPLEII